MSSDQQGSAPIEAGATVKDTLSGRCGALLRYEDNGETAIIDGGTAGEITAIASKLIRLGRAREPEA